MKNRTPYLQDIVDQLSNFSKSITNSPEEFISMSCKIIVIISEHLLQPPNNIQLFFSNTSSMKTEGDGLLNYKTIV